MSGHTPGPWKVRERYWIDGPAFPMLAQVRGADAETDANARLIAAAPMQNEALNYVADMTYCGADGEWHFKPGYDPQRVLAAIAQATATT